MTLEAVGELLVLIGSASACVYVVSRGVDTWLGLPMKGSTIERYEEFHQQKVDLQVAMIWKRGLLVLLGTIVANSIITLLLYFSGSLTEPIRPFLKAFWLLTILFGLPFSEMTFLMDRRKLISPIFIGGVVAVFFAAKHWSPIITKPLRGVLSLAVMFTLGWLLQRYSLRKRGRL